MDELNFAALIPIFGGIYGFLLAQGVIPKNPKDPEKMELWRRKFGMMMKIICPLIVGFGLLQFFRVL